MRIRITMALFFASIWLVGCGGHGRTHNTRPDTPAPQEQSTSNDAAPQTQGGEPYFPYQWYMHVDHDILSRIGYDIDPHADADVSGAWQLTKGAGVLVAVIDDGAEISHPDLAANIVGAYNASADAPGDVSPRGNGLSHGTAISGVIAASENGKGIVGVAPMSKLVEIKLDSADDAAVIRAFEYAKQSGAKVINCSWGTEHVSEAVAAEIEAIYNAGITVVFAAGNDAKNLDEPGIDDESELPWVIGVGASGEHNDVTTYSNYGSALDLIAPGGDARDNLGILSTDRSGSAGFHNQKDLVDDQYAFFDGTSLSAPIVTGAVALMLSVNPNLSPSQIRTLLIGTTQKVGGENADYGGGADLFRGYGKLDVAAAVRAAAGR